MRLTRKQRERKRIEDAERLRRWQESCERKLVSPCELHPGWRVDVSSGRLAPSPAECPFCKREAMRNRDTARDEYKVEHPLAISRATLSQEERAALYFEQHAPIGIQPGSPEEDEALARIEELRDEEQRDATGHGPGGYVAIQRIEGGRLVQYVAPPRRGRSGALGLARVEV